MKTKEKEYVVYGEESGEIKSFTSIAQAKSFIKRLIKFDKEQGIEDVYFIDVIEWSV